jgi:hypothetical protein
MKCPQCGLFNPPSALRCDCGYDFAAGLMKESYLPDPPQEPQGRPAVSGHFWLWGLTLSVAVLLGVAVPSKGLNRRIDLEDVISILVLVGAAPLAWCTLAASIAYGVRRGRASWWLHQTTLALTSGVAVLIALPRGLANASERILWMPFWQFVALGCAAALTPRLMARFRPRG